MRTPALISLVTLFALPLVAVAQIYSWKDASGMVHYSDKPPLEKKVQTRELKSGKTTGGEPAATATKEKAGEGAATAKSEEAANGATKGKSPEQVKAESDARQSLCDNSRKRLIQLEAKSDQIIVTRNEKGESVPLVGDARKAETEAARKDVETWCK
ncbi:MAG: DUF4124 domain-containing protein [Sulfurisoma sp.]|nr:DUF4124 domain-containing protein [Sulfurisoma sp.]